MSRTTPPTAVAPAAVGIRPATVADIDQITATLADAFLDTPDARWLIPDRPARETVYPPLCAVFADYALRHGRVDITSDGSGVAVWYPYTGTDVAPDPAEADRRITAACGRHADRFQLLDATFAARHPQTPHHYLAYLGVTPARQCHAGPPPRRTRHRRAAGVPGRGQLRKPRPVRAPRLHHPRRRTIPPARGRAADVADVAKPPTRATASVEQNRGPRSARGRVNRPSRNHQPRTRPRRFPVTSTEEFIAAMEGRHRDETYLAALEDAFAKLGGADGPDNIARPPASDHDAQCTHRVVRDSGTVLGLHPCELKLTMQTSMFTGSFTVGATLLPSRPRATLAGTTKTPKRAYSRPTPHGSVTTAHGPHHPRPDRAPAARTHRRGDDPMTRIAVALFNFQAVLSALMPCLITVGG